MYDLTPYKAESFVKETFRDPFNVFHNKLIVEGFNMNLETRWLCLILYVEKNNLHDVEKAFCIETSERYFTEMPNADKCFVNLVDQYKKNQKLSALEKCKEKAKYDSYLMTRFSTLEKIWVKVDDEPLRASVVGGESWIAFAKLAEKSCRYNLPDFRRMNTQTLIYEAIKKGFEATQLDEFVEYMIKQYHNEGGQLEITRQIADLVSLLANKNING